MNNDLKQRIERIKQTTDLPDLLLQYGVTLKKQGSGYIARCINPMHEDKNPSMGVYRVKDNNYYRVNCPACGFSEDVVGVYKQLSGDSLPESLDALDGGEIKHSGKPFAKIINEPKATKPERIVSPPPPGTADPVWNRAMRRNENDEWVSLGEPVMVWAYRTSDGALWYYEARYEYIDEHGEIKKAPRCWTWGKRGEMPARWELGFPPPPRPLYGLNELPNAKQALVFEGPKKAESARRMLNGNSTIACLAWPGGANGVSRADWSVLEGKEVIIVPDADDTGRKAANAIAAKIDGLSAKTHIIFTDDLPKAWDIADAEAEGWDKSKVMAFLRQRKKEWEKPMKQHDEDEPPPVDEEYYKSQAESFNEEPKVDYEPDQTLQWPEPLDVFSELQAPPIDLDCLPEPITLWCSDVSGVIGVDPAMLALPAIVACASMLHDGIQIQPERNNPGWRESARLWGALVGDPSSKKSPALSRVLSMVKKIDAECHEKEGKLKYEYSLKEKAHSAAEKTYIEKLSKGEQNLTIPCKPEMPEIPRPYAQDFTVEALRDILKHSSRGILAERDELSGWFGSMDQYKSGGKGGSDRANWLELYNGGSRRIERVGAGSIFVKNWSACVIGGIQPEPLKQLAGNMNDDGLLQRFMVVYGRPGKQGNEQPPDKEIESRYREIVRQIWETEPNPDYPVLLSQDANLIRKEIVDRAYELIGIKLVSNAMVAHLGKWEGLSARLMLTFHAIDCAAIRKHPQACEVTSGTAYKVKRFMLDFLLPHAIQFYSDIMAGSESNKHFRAVANLIIARHPHEITLRDITRGWIGWRHASEQVHGQVINRLIDSGWIQAPIGAKISANRRLATRYICNPMLSEKFARRAEQERKRREEAIKIIETIKGEYKNDIDE